MKITATEKPVRVDYRDPARQYNVNPDNDVDTPTETNHPFDSVTLQPGESWEPAGREFIRAVELT